MTMWMTMTMWMRRVDDDHRDLPIHEQQRVIAELLPSFIESLCSVTTELSVNSTENAIS